MQTAELIRKVRNIEIKTRRIVDEITGGAYHSVFKRRGIEFDEVREYTFSDDVRDIDWNVTARMGAPYIKKYVEERELTVMLLVDVSASGLFGSAGSSKRSRLAEIAALLTFSAIRNHDRVGLMMFSGHTELHLPPRSGKSHGLRIVRELLALEPRDKTTDINGALRDVARALKKRSVIFLLSDFIDNHDFERSMKLVNRRHDLIAVRVLDPLELEWPSGIPAMEIEDAETGGRSFFHNSRASRGNLAALAADIHERAAKSCRRSKVDMIDIRCDSDPVKPLVSFFRRRQGR